MLISALLIHLLLLCVFSLSCSLGVCGLADKKKEAEFDAKNEPEEGSERKKT